MNVVSWFEIPVKDMKRAKTFYGEVFGKKLEDMQSPMPGMELAAFPWEREAPNATGALVKNEGFAPADRGTLIYFEVDDLVGTLERVAPAGGTVALTKTPIGEFGFIGRVLDTEGNAIGLHSMK